MLPKHEAELLLYPAITDSSDVVTDRTNIGNAKIAGLVPDLKLSTGQYNLALTIFFISYSVFEPLTNVLLKKLKPSIFIPTIMWVTRALSLRCFPPRDHSLTSYRSRFFWGSSMVGQGFVYNQSGLLASRWFLGLTEAGLFPVRRS